MTVTALKKVSLIGILEDKEQVLEATQAFGRFHLIPLTPAQRDLEAIPSGTGREAVEALRWLTDAPAQRRPTTDPDDFDLPQIVEQTLLNKSNFKACEDKRAKLVRRIKDVRPWGQFDFADLSEIGDYRLWFYVVPTAKLKAIDPSDKIMEIVHQDKYRAYVVLLDPDEPPLDAMPVPRVHVGEVSLLELEHRLEQTEVRLEGLELERHALTKWRGLLDQHLADARDRAARGRAALETADDERIFVLQAWAPAAEEDDIRSLCQQLGIAAHVEDPAEDEDPPTLLANPPTLAAGEDLVQFYQTPGYRDWDPSIIVYLSFILFFGMIMTDAGYGLLLLGALYLFKKRFGTSPGALRMWTMSVWLMVSTTAFGVLTGSYFGISPPPGSLLAQLKVMQLDDVDTMMKITLTIGVVHITLANVVRALHGRSMSDRAVPIGWSLVAIGGLCTFLGAETLFATIGPVMIVAGLLGVGFFASDRKVDSIKSAGLRLFDAFAGLARIVNIFSDVLSYMRLFALGLAAASLASTINDLSGQLLHAVPGIGLLIAILVLAVGHAINIGLGLIAGVVHGLRLNVIEFFNWGLKDEGTPFRPFKKEESGL
ncbi:V-type ATP synthase subunit I [uncultured Roseibium sp.]|uniref:V-type ATP synthase subunit I n=1 Tax=uncultured Roseibium sp. TaxID=1936171 RepID=UPI002597B24E|nr:V-type ATP synthase subunit I [uncultured Roseibium sp.]